MADIIELLLPLASKKGIEVRSASRGRSKPSGPDLSSHCQLTYEVDPMVPLVVVGDAARLRQIL